MASWSLLIEREREGGGERARQTDRQTEEGDRGRVRCGVMAGVGRRGGEGGVGSSSTLRATNCS